MQLRPGVGLLVGVILAVVVVLDAFVLLFFDRVDLVAFLTFTSLVGGTSALAVVAPRPVGHVLAVLLGVGAIVGGVAALLEGVTAVLPTTLLLAGTLMGAMAFYSWQKSRASWSFLTAMCGVFFICMFFGAPKVRGVLDITIWTALIIPGLLAAATIALAVLHRDYDNVGVAPAPVRDEPVG